MRGFKGECAHFIGNKCPIYTVDDASAKLSTKRITVCATGEAASGGGSGFLPARLQSAGETETGCFLLARSLLALGAHVSGEAESGGGSVL
jgi:hypothetical protein